LANYANNLTPGLLEGIRCEEFSRRCSSDASKGFFIFPWGLLSFWFQKGEMVGEILLGVVQ
jgi:hypothetical protein